MSSQQAVPSSDTPPNTAPGAAPDAAPAETAADAAARDALAADPQTFEGLDTVGPAVALPLPLPVAIYQSVAFALSALLSPYLVIPLGTVVIVASQQGARRQLVLWTSLSIIFSTVIPALYVVLQIARGKITDIHVMEREQRSGPFVVAVISSAVGALVLWRTGAPGMVWGLGVVLLVNGLVLSWITTFWKISMHVAVLTATVLAAYIWVPGISAWSLLPMIPALMWARATRGRHSLWQGLAGCGVSGVLTGGVLLVIRYWAVVGEALRRFF